MPMDVPRGANSANKTMEENKITTQRKKQGPSRGSIKWNARWVCRMLQRLPADPCQWTRLVLFQCVWPFHVPIIPNISSHRGFHFLQRPHYKIPFLASQVAGLSFKDRGLLVRSAMPVFEQREHWRLSPRNVRGIQGIVDRTSNRFVQVVTFRSGSSQNVPLHESPLLVCSITNAQTPEECIHAHVAATQRRTDPSRQSKRSLESAERVATLA